MSAPRTRVLVVGESPVALETICASFRADPDFEVVGTADAASAPEQANLHAPGLIVLELCRAGEHVLDAIRAMMARRPTPILLLTESSAATPQLEFAALSAGAFELVSREQLSRSSVALLVARARLAVRTAVPAEVPEARPQPRRRDPSWRPRLIAIGASTGGPPALATLLKGLTPGLPPIAIVQHMDAAFHQGFVSWLSGAMGQRVQSAADGMMLRQGMVVVAKPGEELSVGGDGVCRLSAAPGRQLHRPSVDGLFTSAAKAFGSHAVGVILTGMGRDGAAGLLELHRAGSLTIAQARASCRVYGMPRAALETGAVEEVMALEEIAGRLNGFTEKPEREGAGTRILVVDDSPVILEATRYALEDAGFAVTTLDNPLMVANAIRRERPHLILIDLNMPAVKGDVIAGIASLHGNNRPMILFSDVPLAELEARARACGATGFIQKTGDEESLVAQVRSFLEAAHVAAR